ncbi:hypothetical protein NLU13_1848 [Sarocladium strictum]|uniref:Rhomboid family membrane protein n=1 Tax=Sarocladium strictum TaxID=5046 RepID=A0AA39GTA7_SARSR|nr:hypothetical protein NLU13_1848 [Sarocladium strictum]
MATDETRNPPLPERNPIIHNFALGGTVLIPLVMALPPRKFDLRFLALASTWSLASNQLAYEYTGTSIYSRIGNRFSGAFDMGLPESAKKTQQLIREQKERDAALKRAAGQEADSRNAGIAGTMSEVWMGGESADWKKKRAEEDRRSLEEGKGFSGIIIDQISDVFSGNWGGSSKKQSSDEDPKSR